VIHLKLLSHYGQFPPLGDQSIVTASHLRHISAQSLMSGLVFRAARWVSHASILPSIVTAIRIAREGYDPTCVPRASYVLLFIINPLPSKALNKAL
jgi:hypothetical protein